LLIKANELKIVDEQFIKDVKNDELSSKYNQENYNQLKIILQKTLKENEKLVNKNNNDKKISK
jgi:hypothetical protein